MKTILLLLLCLCAIHGFRFVALTTFKRSIKPYTHMSCQQSMEGSLQPVTLYTFPKGLAPVNDVISFVQWWGKKQSVQKNSVVIAQNTVKGVQFQMEESPLPLLDVFIDADDKSMMVQVLNNKGNRLKVVCGNDQLLPLLDVVVGNLIDSITSEIGSQLVENFNVDLDDYGADGYDYNHGDRMNTGMKNPLAFGTTNNDASAEERIVEDSRAADSNHERENCIPQSELPSQEDINKLWVETERTPEDDEMMRKFLSGEIPQQDVTIDVDAICEQAENSANVPSHFVEKRYVKSPPEGTCDASVSRSLPSPLLTTLPVEPLNHVAAPPKQHEEDLRILYQSNDANLATVVSVIQMWCQQYTSRGIGISAANTAEGAALTFPFEGAPTLQVNAVSGPDPTIFIQSFVIHNGSSIILDETTKNLIKKARSAIEIGITKELQSTSLTGDTAPSAQTGATQRKLFTIPMDAKLEVDEAVAAVAAASARVKDIDFTPYNIAASMNDDESDDTEENIVTSAQTTPSLIKKSTEPSKPPIYPREHFAQRTSSTPLPTAPPRRRDPVLTQKAAQVGVRLEKYENAGLEEQAIKELNDLLQSSRTKGFMSVIKSHKQENSPSSNAAESIAAGVDIRQKTGTSSESFASPELTELFKAGQRMSSLTLADILNRPTLSEPAESLRGPTPRIPVNLPDSSISVGDSIDIFQSPAELTETLGGAPAPYQTPLHPTSILGKKEALENYDPNRPPDRTQYDLDNARLETLILTLNDTATELHDLVIDGHRDLLLSENILFLLKRAQATTDTMKVRLFYKKIAERSSALVMELGMLFKVESARHLQTIQDVCRITTDYQHDEVQYLDHLEAIKPFFDKEFLSYLNYAIGEEMSKMRKNGVDPTLAPSEWLQVLNIVRKGVEAEFFSRYDHLIESILLVLRWDRPGDDEVRSEIFKRFAGITPAMELPYLKELAVNMIENILHRHAVETGLVPKEPMFSAAASEHPLEPYELEELVVQMKNLQKDVDLHLSDAYIKEKLAEWEEEARQAGTPVTVRHRNSVRQHDIETAHYLIQQAKNGAHMNTGDEASNGFGGLLSMGAL